MDWQYANLARHKLEMARRHLTEFEKEFPNAAVSDPQGADDSRAELEGHADGCVMQAYAAFDTFACGIAVRFGLRKPENASLNRLVPRLEEPSPPYVSKEVVDALAVIQHVVNDDGWKRLSYYRNHAGHKGPLLQAVHRHWEGKITARIGDFDSPYHGNGSEVQPILVQQLEWAEESLPPLLTLLDKPNVTSG